MSIALNKGKKAAAILSGTLLAGFIAHILFLLISLVGQMHAGQFTFSSNIYKAYFISFFFIIMFYVSYLAGRTAIKRPSLFFWVFPAAFLYMVYFFSSIRMYIAIIFYLFTFILTAFYYSKNYKIPAFSNMLGKAKEILLLPRNYLAIIFIVALVVRITYLLRVMSDPQYLATGADGVRMDTFAWNFATRWEYTTIFRNGYWVFLGFVFKIFGHDYFKACLVQSVIGSASCVVVYFIARYLFGTVVARVAALVAALNFSMSFASVSYGHQVIDTFCCLMVVFILSYCHYHPENVLKRKALLAMAGLFLGFAVPVREYNIAFIPIAVLWLFFDNMKERPMRDRLMDIGTMLLFCMLALAPFVYLNLKNVGVIYYVKQCSEGYSLSWWLNNEGDFYCPADMKALGMGSFLKDIKNFIPVVLTKGWPAVVVIAKCYWAKFACLYFNQEYGSFDPIFLVRNTAYSLFLWLYAFIVTFFGMVLSIIRFKQLKEARAILILILMYLFYRTGTHLMLYSCAYRFRVPMEPFLIIFGAFGLLTLYRSAIKR